MLSLGGAFLLVAIAYLFYYSPRGTSWLTSFAWGIYGTNGIGNTLAILIAAGILFVSLGIYALLRQAK
jgi:hypothetical protein